MNATKNLLIALLALATVGGALLAWRQYAELVELRAFALNRDERADLQKRIWDLEKNNRELQDRLAAARLGSGDDVEKMLATVEEERSDDNRRGRGDSRGPGGRGGPPPQFNALRELMNKPEVQAMIAQQQKAALDARYAALFKNLNLSPEQADKLKALLIERQTSRQDVFEAARAQGIDPRENPEAYRKLMADARAQVETSIKSLLGDSGYTQLQTYEQTIPQRGLVTDIQQRLSYSNTPLTATQAEQLVQILAANTPPRPAPGNTTGAVPTTDSGPRGGDRIEFRLPGGSDFGPGRGPDMGMMGAMFGGPGGGLVGAVMDGGRGPSSAPITDAAVNQAQTVLSQPQVAVLKQLQQQQQSQQQLAQMVRQTLGTATQTTTSRSATPGTSAGSTTTAPPSPSRRRPGG